MSRAGMVVAGCGLGVTSTAARAYPLGLPLGLQLYSVRELLAADYAGTLAKIGALGYQEVEAAGYFGRTPAEVNAAMRGAGLKLVSAHGKPADFEANLDRVVGNAEALGLRYVICSFPAFRDPARAAGLSYREQVQAFTLEDFRWSAERFNRWGQRVKAAGMQFGYHNYTMEFVPRNGVVPFDELLRLTDPALVTFELDCGWVEMGGGDPVAYLRRYPERIALLHVKDFKPPTRPVTEVDPPAPAELGRGTEKLRRVFEAARGTAVKHCFVEQEGFNMPPLESLAVDAEYMRGLKV